MSAVQNTSLKKTPVVAKSKSRTAAPAKGKVSAGKSAEPVTKKPAVRVPSEPATIKTLVPGAPEAKKAGTNKRKRLSKAFSRPLDKKIKEAMLVRERFVFPEDEYAQLAEMKKRLSEQGMDVKKSALLRAGFMLLSALDEDALKEILSRVPSV
jgi:PAB1-binding protein PBP1